MPLEVSATLLTTVFANAKKEHNLKKHNFITISICIALLAVLCFGVSLTLPETQAEDAEKVIKIAHFTDIHIIREESCNELSSAYQSADASAIKYLAPSTAFVKKSFEDLYGTDDNPNLDAPLYVLVSGDLTYNGELEGHKKLAEIFAEITTQIRNRPGYEGFQILVIPGNHDIYNQGRGITFTPSEEELDACSTYEEKLELMSNYSAIVEPTSSTDFMEIYKDFGYGGENMVEGELSFFWQSDFWYGSELNSTDINRLNTTYPTQETVDWSEDHRDYTVYDQEVCHGACSYVFRPKDSNVTFVCVDGNSRKYVGDESNIGSSGISTKYDWKQTTSGELSDELLMWIAYELEENNDVENDRLIIGQFHQNVLPHFTMEGELLSMFTYDGYRKARNVLADAGLKYCFSGHMHATDTASFISQNGNVIYDFETGSTTSYGAPYRVTTFKTKGSGDSYVENVDSITCSYEGEFDYNIYTLDEDGNAVMKTCHIGENTSDHFGTKLQDLAKQMIDGYVNDSLYDTLIDMTSSLNDTAPFLADIAASAIKQLKNIDLHKFIPSEDGQSFTLSKDVQEGYDLIAYAKDILDWALNLDLSMGTTEERYIPTKVLFDVYGGHLSGSNASSIDEYPGFQGLINSLEDGSFVNNLVNYILDMLTPQLDVILNAPIRYSKNTPALATAGFDFTEVLNKSYGLNLSGIIQGMVKTYGFDDASMNIGTEEDPEVIDVQFHDENGYSSIVWLLKSVLFKLDSLLENDIIKQIIESFGDISSIIEKYKPIADSYVNEYAESKDLGAIIRRDLVDKYVTDAFCKNLGDYAKRLVISIAIDESYDGIKLVDGKLVRESTHLEYVYNGEKIYSGNSYSKEKVEITPTVENGLLPSNISVAHKVSNGEIAPDTIKLAWETKIYTDILEKDSDGNYIQTCPESYIRYSADKNLSNNVITKKADGSLVKKEYPSVDLGIFYFNMSYLTEVYDDYIVCLEDLSPDTKYYYQVGSDKYGWSEIYSFTTAKASDADSYTIVAISDIQGSIENNYTDSLPNLLTALNKVKNPDFIISCGDNVDNGKNIDQWHWMLAGQAEVWANNAFVGVPGNHEDTFGELSNNVLLPNESTDGLEYYSFFYVNTYYIFLDTNDLENDSLSQTQYDWLIDELTKANEDEKVKWIIVSMHKGLYTAGSHAFDSDVIALRAQLTSVFAEYNVDLVLQGHDHTYSVTNYLDKNGKAVKNDIDSRGAVVNSEGVLYINLGTMGDKFYNYLYSEDIKDAFLVRESVDSKLSSYLTEEGYLELTETPVFMSITADDDKLEIHTYTIVDGKSVSVDDILLSHSFVKDYSVLITVLIAVISTLAVAAAVIVPILVIKKKRKVDNINQDTL